MHQHFGVRVALKNVPRRFQRLFQAQIVLDNAVVDQRDSTGFIRMRVGVDIIGPPVGRPARVRDDCPAGLAQSV